MLVILMLSTILAVLILVMVLLSNLKKIIRLLISIGGDGESYLAKLRLGLRAIETETSHLAPQVTQLNESLTKTAGGLVAVDQSLVNAIEAALQQEKYRS